MFGLTGLWLTAAKAAIPVVVVGAYTVWIYGLGGDAVEGKYARQRAEASEQRRQQEKLDAKAQQAIDDALVEALMDGADLAHDTELRMRELSSKYRAAVKDAAVCRDDAPPGARLSDQTRADLVAEARRANETAQRLAACQASVKR